MIMQGCFLHFSIIIHIVLWRKQETNIPKLSLKLPPYKVLCLLKRNEQCTLGKNHYFNFTRKDKKMKPLRYILLDID